MKDALAGIRVIDLSVNAPGPFASMMLADLGAEVTSIVNPAGAPAYSGAKDDPMLAGRGGAHDALARGKSFLPLNLKSDEGRLAVLDLTAEADVLISEMRPGKLAALGLGAEVLLAANPRLIGIEITGYGGTSPMASVAGHDLNYLAMSGVLSLIRDAQGKPVPPQNIVGDYAAGGAMAVSSVLAALVRRDRTGQGQWLMFSMTDGIRYLASDIAAATVLAGHDEASWRETLTGGMPTYDCYQTSDGEWIAVGALEPKFIAQIAQALDWPDLRELMASKSGWAEARSGLEARFAAQSRAYWEDVFGNIDACVTPVRSLDETAQEGLPTFGDVVRNA